MINFNSLLNTIRSIPDAVGLDTSSLPGLPEGIAGPLGGGGPVDEMTSGKKEGGMFSKIFDAVTDVISSGSLGCMLNTGLDKMGLPDVIGDIAGGVLDFATGNYVGVAANALDACEDLAKACGADDIAGYLKTGAEITSMFSSPTGEIGAIVGKVAQGVDVLKTGAETFEAAKNGDITGMAKGAFGMMGQLAGLSPEHADILNTVSDVGTQVTDWFERAGADGEFSVEDLKDAPLAALATALGIDPEHAQTAQDIVQTVGGVAAGDGPEALIGQFFDALLSNASSDDLKAAAEALSGFDDLKELILTAGSDDAAQSALELLQQGAQLQQTVDVQSHHRANMRM